MPIARTRYAVFGNRGRCSLISISLSGDGRDIFGGGVVSRAAVSRAGRGTRPGSGLRVDGWLGFTDAVVSAAEGLTF